MSKKIAHKYDVVIVGGGLSGLSMAALLGKAGLQTLILDQDSQARKISPTFDGRTTALSLSSMNVLKAADIWSECQQYAAPIKDVKVADEGSALFCHYDYRELGDQPLGCVVENRFIRLAQFKILDRLESVTHIAPARVQQIERELSQAIVTFSYEEVEHKVEALLVIGADGRGSLCREQAEIDIAHWKYDQTAMICNISHEKPHHGFAVEHFMPDGPFAVLPLIDDEEGRHRSSIVWSDHYKKALEYMALTDDYFTKCLARRLDGALGEISLIGQRGAWPLSVLLADSYISTRLALIGEAAHAMHPIAGQGLNLGLRDIAVLAEEIILAHRAGKDIGSPTLLEKYQSLRRFDTVSLIAVTDWLTRFFSNDVLPIKVARRLGLGAVEKVPPAKRLFMKHAMGLLAVGELPKLLRGEMV